MGLTLIHLIESNGFMSSLGYEAMTLKSGLSASIRLKTAAKLKLSSFY